MAGEVRLAKGGHEGTGGFFVAMEAADDEGDVRRANGAVEVEIRLGDDLASLEGCADALLVDFGEHKRWFVAGKLGRDYFLTAD